MRTSATSTTSSRSPIDFAAIDAILPLTFLSAAFMPLALAPDWIQTVARYNPVNWAIEAGREALLASPDWSLILPRVGGLAAVAVVCVILSTRAFRSYQRSA